MILLFCSDLALFLSSWPQFLWQACGAQGFLFTFSVSRVVHLMNKLLRKHPTCDLENLEIVRRQFAAVKKFPLLLREFIRKILWFCHTKNSGIKLTDRNLHIDISLLGYQTNGTRIDVCTNDESCFDCGSTTETRASFWIVFQCPEGTKGNQVKVINPQNYLNVCEIKVYAWNETEMLCVGNDIFGNIIKVKRFSELRIMCLYPRNH